MEVDLEGQAALVVARHGAIVDAIGVALSEKGASVSVSEPGEREPKAAVDLVVERAGRLDVLVVVAEHLIDGASSAPPEGDGLRAALAAPAHEAAIYVCAAAEALTKTAGRIVIVGSALGLLPARLDPLRGAADGALFQLMRGLAMQLGPRGVRINALALGAIGSGTAGDAVLLAGDMRLLSHVPRNRAGTLRDVSDAMLFLADPQNAYMTGHVLPVDGGWVAGFARDF